MAEPNDIGGWSLWAVVLASILITPALALGQEPLVFRSEVDIVRIDLQVGVMANKPARDLTAADFVIFKGTERREALSAILLHNDDGAVVPWKEGTPRITLDPLCLFGFTRQSNEVVHHYLIALTAVDGDRDARQPPFRISMADAKTFVRRQYAWRIDRGGVIPEQGGGGRFE